MRARSIMDSTTGFGPVDEGSIPSELVLEPVASIGKLYSRRSNTQSLVLCVKG